MNWLVWGLRFLPVPICRNEQLNQQKVKVIEKDKWPSFCNKAMAGKETKEKEDVREQRRLKKHNNQMQRFIWSRIQTSCKKTLF